MFSTPLYQATLQHMPFLGSKLTLLLGQLVGRKVNAVVNNAIMRLDLCELIQRMMFLGRYEPDQTQWFKECITVGDTLIDVGASFGYYTTLGSQLVGEEGRVFAFEPSPVANKTIALAIRDSSIDNVALVNAAVGKEISEVQLFLPNTSYLHSPSILYSDEAFESITVPVVTLDTFKPLSKIDCIKLIKIDVEGFEPDVIKGMENLLTQGRVENIICELNSGWLRRNSTTYPEQLNEYIQSLGFYIYKQTALQKNLPGSKGELFDLQDIWYKKVSLPQSLVQWES